MILEKLSQIKSYRKIVHTESHVSEFKEALEKFIALAKQSHLVYSKWSSEALRIDNPRYLGSLTPIFALKSVKMQIHLITLVKLQKIHESLNQMSEVIRREVLTQYSLTNCVDNLMSYLGETMIYELYVKVILFLADLLMTLSDYHGAIRLYQIMRVISDMFSDLRSHQTVYCQLGECYKILGDYKKAMHNLELYLHTSWFLRDLKNELKAYDSIGMLYYYQNDLEKAQRYHLRSLRPDSALDSPGFDGMVKARITEESSRKQRLIAGKDLYFKYEVTRDLLTFKEDVEEYIKLRSISQYLTSVFAVDNLAVLGPTKPLMQNREVKHTSLALKILNSKKQNYKANFTPEGYTRAMQLSNPAKYGMIQDGTMKLDDANIKNINLYDNTYTAVEDQKVLSHLSTNNTKLSFSNSTKSSEVCLQFLQNKCKEKMKVKVDSMKDDILEFIEFLLDQVAGKDKTNSSYK